MAKRQSLKDKILAAGFKRLEIDNIFSCSECSVQGSYKVSSGESRAFAVIPNSGNTAYEVYVLPSRRR